MSNQNLKHALTTAGLTVEAFAEIIEVDPKTVQRWVAGATVPYQRNQATVAQALGLEPHDLWPDTITTSPGQPARPEPADPGAPLGDVVGSWGHANDPDAPDVAAIVSQAERRVDVRHDSRARLTDSTITAILDRADHGCQVQIVINPGAPELTPLIRHQQVEIRIAGTFNDHATVRADDEMLVFFVLAGPPGQHPPVLHLRRRTDGGLFDRFIDHRQVERAKAGDRLTDPAQLGDRPHLDDPHRPDHGDTGRATQTPGQTDPTEQPSTPPPEDHLPRRWPRRSD